MHIPYFWYSNWRVRAATFVKNKPDTESEMPKMKTKSSAKKRFKITASGKVKSAQAGKRHGMIKRSSKFIRNARGTTLLSKSDESKVKSFMPNSG